MDHPADLQLKDCWLFALGRDPVLLVEGREARADGVTVLKSPTSTHGRKVWRFRFTYTIPEGTRNPYTTAFLKCRAGLEVSATPSQPCDGTILVPIGVSRLMGLSHTVG